MKDKLYDPARTNEQSPAPGMAATNTFNTSSGEDGKLITDEEQEQAQRQTNSETIEDAKERE